MQELESCKSDLMKEVAAMKNDIENYQSQNANTQQMLIEKQKQVEELQSSKLSLQNRLDENKAFEEVAHNQNVQLKLFNLQGYEDKVRSLEVMLEVEKAQNADLLEFKTKLKEATLLVRDQEEQILRLEGYISQYQEADALLQLELRKSSQAIGDLQKHILNLESRHTGLQDQIDRIPRDMTVALAEIRALQNDLKKNEEHVKKLQKEHAAELKQQQIDFKNYMKGFEVEKNNSSKEFRNSL
eukprot:CAMPEP_0117738266 /NCGR_PEP_ID=MMETSP0947-20121206/3021_1 /TAXON_ID=44440 /ORGANISM="Chattonella subsalsa, Strain CCMP2191" /LENGTH=241 /DNA_ID=CAMNT_0005553911 /DNA_START=15 /DNA_END=742 /DNA_ORIENTATION=-